MWLFILSAITATMLSPAVKAATCSNFSAVNNPYNNGTIYTETRDTHRVSAIVNCTGTHLNSQLPAGIMGKTCNSTQCALWTSEYYAVELHAYLNLTAVSNDTMDNILQLVYNTTYGAPNHDPNINADLNRTSVHHLGGDNSICINEPEQAFWGFTPYYECVEGVLNSCSGDGAPANNTPITVCGPKLQGDIFFGDYHIVQDFTGKDSSSPAPPNATVASSTTSTPSPTNANGGGAFIKAQGPSMLVWISIPLLVAVALPML